MDREVYEGSSYSKASLLFCIWKIFTSGKSRQFMLQVGLMLAICTCVRFAVRTTT